MSIYATRRWRICLKWAEEHWASTEAMGHCLTMCSVEKFCTNGVRLSRHWNGSIMAGTWWITADKPLYIFGGSEIYRLPLYSIVPLWKLIYRRFMIDSIKYYPVIMKSAPPFCSFIKKLYLCASVVISLVQNNKELWNRNGCHLVTQFSSNPNNRLILR